MKWHSHCNKEQVQRNAGSLCFSAGLETFMWWLTEWNWGGLGDVLRIFGDEEVIWIQNGGMILTINIGLLKTWEIASGRSWLENNYLGTTTFHKLLFVSKCGISTWLFRLGTPLFHLLLFSIVKINSGFWLFKALFKLNWIIDGIFYSRGLNLELNYRTLQLFSESYFRILLKWQYDFQH